MFVDNIILEIIDLTHAQGYYDLYKNRAQVNGDNCFLSCEEEPLDFLKRINSYCDALYIIKTIDNPNIIIGDIALHHYDVEDKSIQFGGTIISTYWGKNIMKLAFEQVKEILQKDFEVNKIVGVTTPDNTKAIRLVEKLNFVCVTKSSDKVIYELVL